MANEVSESSSLLPKDATIPTSYGSKKPLKELRPEPIEPAEAEDEDLNDPSLTRVISEGRKAQYTGNTALRKQMPYILPALAIGIFLSAADQTIIVSSYGKIGSDLNALSSTSWIATAYFLTLTSFQPLYGKLSDIFGRKPCLLFAYLVFGLGTLLCGLSQNINQLIAARAFAGIGGGGMTTVVSILMSDAIPLKDRGLWQGFINIIYATGAGVGAPAGGILADGVGWRWAFLAQAPLCLLAFIAVLVVLKEPEPEIVKKESDWRGKLKRVDFLGALMLVLAVFALLLGMDRGSNVSWRAKECLIPLCLSIPLFALFILVEVKVASEPFAPGHVVFNTSLFAAYMCNFFSFAGYLAALFYIPLYFQAVHGDSASRAGVLLIPAILCGVSGSLFGGIVMKRTGKYYWLTVIAYLMLSVGLLGILLFSGAVIDSTIGIIISSSLCAFGNGIGVTSTLIALISNAKHDDQAVATACSYLFRSLGSTTGVSLTSSAANQVLRSSLEKKLSSGKDAAVIVEGVRRTLAYIKTLEPETRELVRSAYGVSTRAAYGVDVGLVVGAALAAWFIKEKPLSR